MGEAGKAYRGTAPGPVDGTNLLLLLDLIAFRCLFRSASGGIVEVLIVVSALVLVAVWGRLVRGELLQGSCCTRLLTLALAPALAFPLAFPLAGGFGGVGLLRVRWAIGLQAWISSSGSATSG